MARRSSDPRDRVDPYVRAIIDNARKKGFLTYDELNAELPEDAVDNIDLILSSPFNPKLSFGKNTLAAY